MVYVEFDISVLDQSFKVESQANHSPISCAQVNGHVSKIRCCLFKLPVVAEFQRSENFILAHIWANVLYLLYLHFCNMYKVKQ
jgi:hypothetical protein